MTATTGTNYDVQRLANTLKQTYADKITQLVPEEDKIAKLCDFIEAEKQPGGGYNVPVRMTRSMGATFNSDGSIFRLNKPLAPLTLNATVNGTEFVLREAMSYGILNRALKGGSSKKASARAFVSATRDTAESMAKGASYFREANLLYGGGTGAVTSLGAVSSVVSAVTTTLVVQLTAAEWATGLWAGSEGGEFDVYSSAGTKKNTAGTATDAVYKLVSVSSELYQLTFTSHATNVSAVAANDLLFFAGARGTEMLGIFGAIQTSGSLWGISTTTYGLWKPKITAVGGALTFEKIMQGVVKVADIGFDGTLQVHVSPASWQDINDDQAALVRHADQAGGTVKMGYEKIEFYGQTGTVKIVPNKYIKRGYAAGLPEGKLQRVGSSDITFDMPGYGKMIRELEDYAGIEVRMYWDQAFFTETPGFMHLWTGISNTVD